MKPLRYRGPIGVALTSAAVAFLPPILLDRSVVWFLHHYGAPLDLADWRGIRAAEVIYLCICAAYLAASIPSRHPRANASYLRWLLATPWQPGKPLPLGSPLPGWREIIMLAGLVASCSFYLHFPGFIPVAAFAIVYALFASFTLLRTGLDWTGTALLFLLLAIIPLWPNLRAIGWLAGAMLVISCWGIWRSLWRYPWKLDAPKPVEPDLGTLLSNLGPKSPKPEISASTALIISLLLGWALYCFTAHTHPRRQDVETARVASAAIAILLGMIRWAVYAQRHKPPLSFFARFATGRLIIPGYDYILLAPIAAAMSGFALPIVLLNAGVPAAVTFSITTTITFMILLLAPPSIRTWRLIGHHRISVGPASVRL